MKCRCLFVLSVFVHALAVCSPKNPQIVYGQADFQEGTVIVGDRAIIHWQEFSIAPGEVVRFVQPSVRSAVLNRVTGGHPSALLGRLEANGGVFLLNPNGIIIGRDAVIDTGRFVASTLDVLDTHFLHEQSLLFEGSSQASVVNLGKINAWDGDVILVGRYVDNQGTIQAPQGIVGLAAGSEVLLKLDGEERLFIRPLFGEGVGVGINHQGVISALRTELEADGNLYALGINVTGKVDALKMAERGGKIYLLAEGGKVNVEGSLVAPSGEVCVSGELVTIGDAAYIDASDDLSGGCVFIGGGFHGEDPSIVNAKQTYVAPQAQIAVSSRVQGDAGSACIWSDEATGCYATIQARGGQKGGNGGFVEISSKGHLDYRGSVIATAPFGETGMLLLDPSDVVINTAGPSSGGAFGPCSPSTWNASSASSVIQISDLITQLGSCHVTISSLSSASGNGDIIVANGFSYNSPNNLTLQTTLTPCPSLAPPPAPAPAPAPSTIAGRDIIINSSAPITNTGTGALFLCAQRDIVINTLSNITYNAGSAVTLNALRDISVQVVLNNTGAGGITATAGNNFIVGAYGSIGVDAAISTTTGPITLATGVFGKQGNFILSSNASAPGKITSTSGSITITAGYDFKMLGGFGISPVEISSTLSNTIQITAGNDIQLNAGFGSNAHAQILGTGVGQTNTINLTAGNNVMIQAGRGASDFGLVQTSQGNINILAQNGNVLLNCPIGAVFGRAHVLSDQGTINLTATKGDVLLWGFGSSLVSPNFAAVETRTGNINISAAGDVTLLTASSAGGGYAQIVTTNTDAANPTTITINAGKDLTLLGSANGNTYAQIGMDPSRSGNPASHILINSVGRDLLVLGNNNIRTRAVTGYGYALIGHGGINELGGSLNDGPSVGTRSGNITINHVGRNIVLQGGAPNDGTLSDYFFAQIGHTGSFTNKTQTITGNILIHSATPTVLGSVKILGGARPTYGYALLGHGCATGASTNHYGEVLNLVTIDAAAKNLKIKAGISTTDTNFAVFGIANRTPLPAPPPPPSAGPTVTASVDAITVSTTQAASITSGLSSSGVCGLFTNMPLTDSVLNHIDVTTGTDLFVIAPANPTGTSAAAVGIYASSLNTTLNCTVARDLSLSGGSGSGGTSDALMSNGSALSFAPPPPPAPSGPGQNTNISVGRNALLTAQSRGKAEISSSGTLTLAITGNLDMTSSASFKADLHSGSGPMTVTVGKDVTLTGNGAQAGLDLGAGASSLTVGRSIFMNSGQITTTNTSTGLFTLKADSNLIMQGTSMIDLSAATNAALDLVVDNQAPSSPIIGPSLFVMTSGVNINSSTGQQLRIYTARATQNMIQGLLQGSPFSGSYGVAYYPGGSASLPTTVFVKVAP